MSDDLTISIDDGPVVLTLEGPFLESSDVGAPDIEIKIENPDPETANEPPATSESVAVAEKGDKGDKGDQGDPGPPGTVTSDLDTSEIVAAEDLPALCFVTSGGNIADSSNPFHFNRVLGILMSPVAVDNIATVVIEGEVTDPSWDWAPNLKLFLNGTTLSTVPTSSGFSQLVGLTRNSNTIFIRLQVPVRL